MQNSNFHFSAHKSNFPDETGRQRKPSKGIKQNKKKNGSRCKQQLDQNI